MFWTSIHNSHLRLDHIRIAGDVNVINLLSSEDRVLQRRCQKILIVINSELSLAAEFRGASLWGWSEHLVGMLDIDGIPESIHRYLAIK